MEAKTRTVLVRTGGDWTDASADAIEAPIDANMLDLHEQFREEWESRHEDCVFVHWLLNHGCTASKIEEFQEV